MKGRVRLSGFPLPSVSVNVISKVFCGRLSFALFGCAEDRGLQLLGNFAIIVSFLLGRKRGDRSCQYPTPR